MKGLLIGIAAAAALASGAALAQPEILKAKGCLGCHELDKKKVGPAFKDVAAKYKGDAAAAATVVGKMKEGKGHPKLSVPEAELKSAVETALQTK